MEWSEILVAALVVFLLVLQVWMVEAILDLKALVRYLLRRDGNQWVGTLSRYELYERERENVRHRP